MDLVVQPSIVPQLRAAFPRLEQTRRSYAAITSQPSGTSAISPQNSRLQTFHNMSMLLLNAVRPSGWTSDQQERPSRQRETEEETEAEVVLQNV
jgi:hypothetical protein